MNKHQSTIVVHTTIFDPGRRKMNFSCYFVLKAHIQTVKFIYNQLASNECPSCNLFIFLIPYPTKNISLPFSWSYLPSNVWSIHLSLISRANLSLQLFFSVRHHCYSEAWCRTKPFQPGTQNPRQCNSRSWATPPKAAQQARHPVLWTARTLVIQDTWT